MFTDKIHGGDIVVFNETLTRLRKSKGLSQEQLAEELNVARQTVSKWETGQSTPDIEYLSQISDLFEVSTDYLIKGECLTDKISKSDEKECADNGKSEAYKWCFYSGFAMFLMSLSGIIIFVICSAFKPFTAMINGKTYTKIWGFLIGTHTLWFFIILCVLLVVGVCLSAYGILKNLHNKTK